MRNPLRSEAEAFRFLLMAVGYFALIVAAAAIETWLGVVVFAVLTALAVLVWLRARRDEPPLPVAVASHAEDLRRILVIANETVGGDELFAVITERAEGVDEEVLVVCPALNSPLRTWVSDEDGARANAQERLDRSLARLAAAGVDETVLHATLELDAVRRERLREPALSMRRPDLYGQSGTRG